MNGFKQFMRKVDSVLSSKIGMGHADLVDCAWYGYFEDGLTPSEACESAYEDMLSDEIPASLWHSNGGV